MIIKNMASVYNISDNNISFSLNITQDTVVNRVNCHQVRELITFVDQATLHMVFQNVV